MAGFSEILAYNPERLASHHGVTLRAMLERIVMSEDARVTSSMDDEAWEVYMQSVTR